MNIMVQRMMRKNQGDRDYYFRITDIAGEEIDPNNPDGDSEPESEAAFVSNQNNFLK